MRRAIVGLLRGNSANLARRGAVTVAKAAEREAAKAALESASEVAVRGSSMRVPPVRLPQQSNSLFSSSRSNNLNVFSKVAQFFRSFTTQAGSGDSTEDNQEQRVLVLEGMITDGIDVDALQLPTQPQYRQLPEKLRESEIEEIFKEVENPNLDKAIEARNHLASYLRTKLRGLNDGFHRPFDEEGFASGRMAVLTKYYSAILDLEDYVIANDVQPTRSFQGVEILHVESQANKAKGFEVIARVNGVNTARMFIADTGDNYHLSILQVNDIILRNAGITDYHEVVRQMVCSAVEDREVPLEMDRNLRLSCIGGYQFIFEDMAQKKHKYPESFFNEYEDEDLNPVYSAKLTMQFGDFANFFADEKVKSPSSVTRKNYYSPLENGDNSQAL